jgi:hypothetical protein
VAKPSTLRRFDVGSRPFVTRDNTGPRINHGRGGTMEGIGECPRSLSRCHSRDMRHLSNANVQACQENALRFASDRQTLVQRFCRVQDDIT